MTLFKSGCLFVAVGHQTSIQNHKKYPWITALWEFLQSIYGDVTNITVNRVLVDIFRFNLLYILFITQVDLINMVITVFVAIILNIETK